MMTATSTPESNCTGCPTIVDRRRFLRQAATSVVATLLATGLGPAAALADSVSEIVPRRTAGARLAYAVPKFDSVLVDSDNEVIVARWQNRIYAFSLKCPHRGERLEWRESESKFFCPKHKARFARDGSHVSGRKTSALDRYPIRREGNEILVSRDFVITEDENPAMWSSASLRI